MEGRDVSLSSFAFSFLSGVTTGLEFRSHLVGSVRKIKEITLPKTSINQSIMALLLAYAYLGIADSAV